MGDYRYFGLVLLVAVGSAVFFNFGELWGHIYGVLPMHCSLQVR